MLVVGTITKYGDQDKRIRVLKKEFDNTENRGTIAHTKFSDICLLKRIYFDQSGDKDIDS